LLPTTSFSPPHATSADTAPDVAARLADIGFAMDWTTIRNIEDGRRKTIPLDCVFAIA
jgi:hypothetical protein